SAFNSHFVGVVDLDRFRPMVPFEIVPTNTSYCARVASHYTALKRPFREITENGRFPYSCPIVTRPITVKIVFTSRNVHCSSDKFPVANERRGHQQPFSQRQLVEGAFGDHPNQAIQLCKQFLSDLLALAEGYIVQIQA